MFYLLAFLVGASSAAPQPPKVERRASAAVRIVSGRANSAQREIIHVEVDGSRTLLRLTEFQ